MLRLTVKSFLAHKVRFLLTAVAVILGVAFMSGTMVLSDTLKRTFDDLFANVFEGTDAYVRSTNVIDTPFGESRGRIPRSALATVEGVPGVEAASPDIQFFAQPVGDDGKAIGGQGPPSLGFNWTDSPELNTFRIVAGHPPRRDGEIVIDKGSADDGHIEVGDRITVLTQQAPKRYLVAGIARFGDADSPGGATITMFTTAEAARISGAGDELDGISVAAEPGVTQEEIRTRVARALPRHGFEVITGRDLTEENQNQVEEGLSFFNRALLIFAGVALLVGCFVIFNSFSIVVAQRSREMALLRAIGATGRQVTRSVLGESALVGLVASTIGLGAGVLLALALKSLLAAFGIDLPAAGVVVTTGTVVSALVVGTVVTVVSAVFPARRAAKVPPVAMMRAVAVEKPTRFRRRSVIGAGLILVGAALLAFGLFTDVDNRIAYVGVGALAVFFGVAVLGPILVRPASRILGAPMARFSGISGVLARENALRSPRRTAATSAALMIGVALVGFITIFAASTKDSIAVALKEAMRADFVIQPKGAFGGGPQTGFSPELAHDVAALPEVRTATGIRIGVADVDGSGQFLLALDPRRSDAVFDLDVKSGDFAALSPDGIAVSEKVADDHGWRVGSPIRLRTPERGTRTVRVEAVFGRGQQAGFTDYMISLAGFERSFANQLDAQVYILLAPGVSNEAGRRAIEKVVEAYPNAELKNQAEFRRSQEAQINQLVNLVYALLALAVIVALIGIANTLALSIHERTRELGLLRAVGMSRRQLRSSIRWESVIIALFGTALGLAVGIMFGWAVVRALRDQGITQFAIPPAQIVVIVVVAALAGVAAAHFPARRAAKLDVLQAVSSE
ncbi:MAG: FtsX-like permease family protein [Acidimicrobiia bacterium]|nr:FtsX-like permease family protein [Acidimicrobiia bacterium]